MANFVYLEPLWYITAGETVQTVIINGCNVVYLHYKNGYYYWEETGGHTDEGFACLTLVEKLDKRRYSVWFEIYGMGENWDNDVCYYTTAEALPRMIEYGLENGYEFTAITNSTPPVHHTINN